MPWQNESRFESDESSRCTNHESERDPTGSLSVPSRWRGLCWSTALADRRAVCCRARGKRRAVRTASGSDSCDASCHAHAEAGVGTQGNLWSDSSPISAGIRYVAFASLGSNLVTGDTNGEWDVFVHDRQTGDTTRVSVASDGTQGNGPSWWTSISGDGRYVAFTSGASTLVTDDTKVFCDADNDGVYVDNCADIFVHDRETGETTRVSVASDGAQANDDSSAPSMTLRCFRILCQQPVAE